MEQITEYAKNPLIIKAEDIYNKGIREATLIYNDGREEKKRIGRTSTGDILIMVNRSRTRGRYLSEYLREGLKDIQEIAEKDKSILWINSINKAIKLLESSGLWYDLLQDLKIAKAIGFNKLQEAYKTQDLKLCEDYHKNQEEQVKKIKEIDERLISVSKETGKEFYKTSILWYMVFPLKIKKMNFGGRTEEYNSNIAYALLNKEKLRIPRIRVNYDVSFEYDGLNKAWYSEEFKDCGNGHYFPNISINLLATF